MGAPVTSVVANFRALVDADDVLTTAKAGELSNDKETYLRFRRVLAKMDTSQGLLFYVTHVTPIDKSDDTVLGVQARIEEVLGTVEQTTVSRRRLWFWRRAAVV